MLGFLLPLDPVTVSATATHATAATVPDLPATTAASQQANLTSLFNQVAGQIANVKMSILKFSKAAKSMVAGKSGFLSHHDMMSKFQTAVNYVTPPKDLIPEVLRGLPDVPMPPGVKAFIGYLLANMGCGVSH